MTVDEALARAGPLMRRAALASVSVSVLLVAIKAGAYFASHSVAMLASMADSALDLLTSSLNLLAIRQALVPADAEHRFGHGKAEPLAGMAQGVFICASALFLVIQAGQALIAPAAIEHTFPALAVMGVSIMLVIALVAYQRHVVARTGSLAVRSDLAHYASDLAINLGVVAALVLAVWPGWPWADPIIALGVVGIMLWGALGVMRESLDQLMDRELPDAARARIRAIVESHPAVCSLHDLRTRAAGLSVFIQAHVELDPGMSLAAAHAVSDAVEQALLAAYPGAQVIIHQDPAGQEAPPPAFPD